MLGPGRVPDNIAKDFTPGRDADDLTKDQDGGVTKITRDSGIMVGPMEERDKDVCEDGKRVYIHYVLKWEEDTGELLTRFDQLSGNKFTIPRKRYHLIDDTYSKRYGKEYSFILGEDPDMVEGLTMAIRTMKRRESARIIVKPSYGYGKKGNKELGITAKTILVYVVQVMRWDEQDLSPDHDNSIHKTVLEEPENYKFDAFPREGGSVDLELTGWNDGEEFMKKRVTYDYGECGEHDLPEGIDMALNKIGRGEKLKLHLDGKWGYCYGYMDRPDLGYEKGDELDFEIKVHDVKPPLAWDAATEEKISCCQELKEKAYAFLQQGKFHLAVNKYDRMIGYLTRHRDYDEKDSEDEKAELNKLLIAAYLNMSHCYLKKGGNGLNQTMHYCDEVLKIDEENIKANYRKAQAYEEKNEFADAIKLFKKVYELEPTNKAALKRIRECREKHKKLKEKESKLFDNMFDRFTKTDRNEEWRVKDRKKREEWKEPRAPYKPANQ